MGATALALKQMQVGMTQNVISFSKAIMQLHRSHLRGRAVGETALSLKQMQAGITQNVISFSKAIMRLQRGHLDQDSNIGTTIQLACTCEPRLATNGSQTHPSTMTS